MENSHQDQNRNPEDKKPRGAGGPNVWLLVAVLLAMAMLVFSTQGRRPKEVSYTFFRDQLDRRNVERIAFQGDVGQGKFKKPPYPLTSVQKGKVVFHKFKTNKNTGEFSRDSAGNLQPVDPKLKPLDAEFSIELPIYMSEDEKQALTSKLAELEKNSQTLHEYSPATDNSAMFVILVGVVLPLLLFFFLWMMFRRTRDQIMGGGFLSGFGKSPAKRYESVKQPVTFEDVAGLGGVKADLAEIIEFLKNPEKFQRLGGRVPKGVLLNGPPGTGKTLLARAVAGEAGVPFYSVNGSEFIQMFVGVGASRVRDLFQKAKENSPSIMFIDEIDAVGRQRGAGLGGGHDEREQTLNQYLSEMDGFNPTDSVIVMAATNRPDVLDPALLRPGRFDRHVTVDRPTLKGRIEMFKVHVRDVPLSDDVDLKRLAEGSIGLTGADIRNMVNEAALWATRNDKKCVEMDDFEYARDKVLMGPKREEVLTPAEKEKTAYHEAGHALLAWLTKGNDRVHKVTVIPRGRALGVTQTLPEEDKLNVTEGELCDRLAFMLGGRAAEKLIYDQYSAGAENDLERATGLARCMVTKWGMSEILGPVSYKLSDDDPFLGREMHAQRQFSEHTLQIIDKEVVRILRDADELAFDLLKANRDKLDAVAQGLITEEELNDKEITELIGPSVHESEKTGGSQGQLAAKDSISQAEV